MAALLYLCPSVTAFAKVKLPTVFSDGVVLQRAQPVKVWGTADAGETVNLQFVSKSLPSTEKGKKLKATYQTTADSEGRWQMELPALKPGGPYVMMVGDETVKDVLVGDVWLCSGQSNMELPVNRVTDLFADEIAADRNALIHHIQIPKVTNFHSPQSDIPPTQWKALNPQDAMDFSALGYFFAKAMYEKTGVPVGIVNASWGGTPVQSWISEPTYGELGLEQYINEVRACEDDAYRDRLTRSEQDQMAQWLKALYRGDAGRQEATPWQAADYDDSAWTTVDMFAPFAHQPEAYHGAGSYWFRQTVTLPELDPTQDATLRLGCMVDADSVWVNGQFVGNITYQYPPRIYRLPAGLLKEGDNQLTVRIVSYGGEPSFVKEKPYKVLYHKKGETALSEQPLGTQWKMRLGAPMPNGPGSTFFCYKPICLYNAMIAPLIGLRFQGAIWYQGESNVGREKEYETLLKAMIANWRKDLDAPSLPFLIVELADFLPYDDLGGRAAWQRMRDTQAKVAGDVENAYLVPNKDLGEWNDIHPLDKKTLGQRAAGIVEEHILKK